MSDPIASRVAAVIARAQHIDVERVTAESTFAELGIDSLDGLSIIFELEDEFGIEIPDEDARRYTSVAQAAEGVALLVGRKAAAAPPAA